MTELKKMLLGVGSLSMVGSAAAQAASPSGKERAATPPNILFLVVDDLKPNIGPYGDRIAHTPAFERIAASGVTFMNNYCQFPLSGPTRASVLTGLRPDHTGVWTLDGIFRRNNPDIVSLKAAEIDDETAKSVVLEALGEALVGLVAMREKEGATQVADISAKLDTIESALGEIASVAPQVVADYRAKLAARIREALGDNLPEESRIATEVALFADKCAIDEEISRLTAHIAAMRAHLKSTAPVGRKLDFLVQEMNREANTIGSKANDLRITERVLAIKNDIEKIREQAQNVE